MDGAGMLYEGRVKHEDNRQSNVALVAVVGLILLILIFW